MNNIFILIFEKLLYLYCELVILEYAYGLLGLVIS